MNKLKLSIFLLLLLASQAETARAGDAYAAREASIIAACAAKLGPELTRSKYAEEGLDATEARKWTKRRGLSLSIKPYSSDKALARHTKRLNGRKKVTPSPKSPKKKKNKAKKRKSRK